MESVCKEHGARAPFAGLTLGNQLGQPVDVSCGLVAVMGFKGENPMAGILSAAYLPLVVFSRVLCWRSRSQ